MPAVVQVASSLSRTISYQFDQISLSWNFDSEAADMTYPGFDVLSKELDSTFGYFAEVVEKMADTPLKVQGCACNYENVLDNVNGADWIVGYLSNWEEKSARNRLTGQGYVGFRYSGTSDNEDLNTHRVVSAQLDSGRDVGMTTLGIAVTSTPQTTSLLLEAPPRQAAKQLLDDAHDILISTFETLANDVMRTAWGKR
jgi:hypothetical protein